MRAAYLTCILLAACNGSDPYIPPPPPVATDDVVMLVEDEDFAVTELLANDVYVPGKSFEIVESPQHGTVMPGPYGGPSVYQPHIGYHGADRFTYMLRDQGGESEIATVRIDVMSDGVPYERSKQLATTDGVDVALGDVSGDGRLDVVVADTYSSTVSVIVDEQIVRFEGGHEPWAVDVADLDGDGRGDIVVASGTDGIVVLRNRGGSVLAFDAPVYLPTIDAARDVVLADVDRDGSLDLAWVDYAADTMSVRLNASSPGMLAFGVRYDFATPDGPFTIATGDADGAGGPDLIVLARTAGALSLFVNAMAIGEQAPAFAARVDRATGTQPTSVLIADLDADQRTEIAVIDSSQLWIYANRSDSYIAARVLDLPYGSQRMAALQLDGVGPLDLVIGTRNDYPYAMLLNQSSSDFAFNEVFAELGMPGTATRVQTGDTQSFAVGDLDGDGRPEIVATGSRGTFVLFD